MVPVEAESIDLTLLTERDLRIAVRVAFERRQVAPDHASGAALRDEIDALEGELARREAIQSGMFDRDYPDRRAPNRRRR